MSLLKTVTDAAWPTSGTPTAGNTGFDLISSPSGGTLIFEVDENGEKYISTTAPGQSILVRHDAIASVFANSATQYRHEMVFFGEFTGQSGSTALGTPVGFFVDFDGTGGSGPRCTVSFGVNNDGFTTGFYASFGSPGGTATAYGGLAGTNRESIPINAKWTAQFFAEKAASGIAGLLINGVRVGAWTAATSANYSSNVYWTLPQIPGIRWRIYATTNRPARSWTGSEPSVFTPLYTTYARDTDGLVKSFPHIANDGKDGLLWSYSTAPTISTYTNSGTNPVRSRITGPVGGTTATSVNDVGPLPYNKYGDCAILTSFYVPSAGSYSIAIRNSENTADILKLQVASGQLQDSAGQQLTASDGSAVAISTSVRYFLVLNFNSSGNASWTLIDATSAPTQRLVWSNALPSRSIGSVGKIIVTVSQSVEADRVDICRWWTNAICDSLVADFSTTATPQLVTTANNLGVGFPHGDGLAVPGSAYGCDQYGWPKETFMVTSGRAGYTRALWATNSRAYMTHTRAMRLFVVDGGCFNDLNGGTTATQLIQYCQDDLDFCSALDNEMILTPSFNRPYGLTFSLSTSASNQRRKYNALMPAFVAANSNNSRLYFCDHFRAYREVMITTDGVHPSASLDACCRAIAGTRTPARQYAGATKDLKGNFDSSRNIFPN